MQDLSNGKYKYLTLSNGTKMPPIGFGTYKLVDIQPRVETAIKAGYRLIDTAKLYDNEAQIGEALTKVFADNIVKREDLFIVTKLWQDDHEDPVKALKIALEKLKLSYVDLYLIHWPLGVMENGVPKKKVPLHILWSNMEKCVEMGLCKSIGVSNFNAQLLLDLVSYAKIQPVINQVELNPYFTQNDLVDVCKALNIKIMAYMPACKGSSAMRHKDIVEKYDLYKNELICHLANKYKRTPAQIVLNWHLHRGIIPLPRSNSDEHIKENMGSVEFEMEEKEYEAITGLNMNMRLSIGKDKNFSLGFEIFA